jgi:predicted phage terminase large subunit-like protein
MPPGTGKSTLAIFYLTWLAGKYPDAPMLTGSHSNSWVRGAYDECLRIMDANGEYLWHDVFPDVQVSSTNAKDCRIDLGKRKRFETLEFTSIGTGNAGLYRAQTLLYCDDLVSGIEVAMSRERLDKLWEIYNTDLRQRKIGARCKELHIATRWSVADCIGRLEMEYGDSDRARFIVMPAVDENDESNFDYPYDVGFSTKFYHEQREIMDDVNWRALYMNQPIERFGLLYNSDELRRYFELPDGEPDAIVAVCDTKTKGSDYCVMPVAYQYGADFYIDAVICDNSNNDSVEPRLASLLTEKNVQIARFESNQAGGKIAEKIQGMVKELGGRAKLNTKYTTANKETRIIVAQPFVLEHCLFKDDSVVKKDKEYRRFLQMMCGYTTAGRNAHDDVPDALAMLSEFIQSSFGMNRVEIVKRPF